MYQLEYSDLREFEVYVQNHSGGVPARIKLFGFIGVIFVFSILGTLTSSSQSNSSPNPLVKIGAVLIPVLIVASVWIVQFKLALIRQEKEFKADPVFSKPHKIRLDSQSVFYQDSTGEGTTKWSSLHKVVEGNNAIYLFTSPKIAYLVPKRAFSTTTEAQQFYREAHNHWQQAQA